MPESERDSATGVQTRFNHYTTRTPTVSPELIMDISFLVLMMERLNNVIVRLFVHLDDLCILNRESYMNDTLLVAITFNQAFCKVYDIWQLVYMVHWFLFSCYKEIYKCKLVNSPKLLFTWPKFYSPPGVYMRGLGQDI